MMDKNTTIGLLLIGLILIGFSIFNSPSNEELSKQKRQQDSLAAIEKLQLKEARQQVLKDEIIRQNVENANAGTQQDSAAEMARKEKFGAFYQAVTGSDTVYTLENEVLKLSIRKKGGRIGSALLKNYLAHDSLPLQIGDMDSSGFAFSFYSQNRITSTDSLFFEPVAQPFSIKGSEKGKFVMRASAGEGRYIEYVYSLYGNSYLFDFTVNLVGINEVMATNTTSLNLNWNLNALNTEKYKEGESNATTIYYKHDGDEVDYLSETSDEKEEIPTPLKWVGFKQQYFTSVLVAKEKFETAQLETVKNEHSKRFTKKMRALLTVPVKNSAKESLAFSFYIGPNHFQTMKTFQLGIEEQIPLGWGILGWINRFCVIPVFNFLNSFNMSYGLIILILTILIKVVIFPLTYKAYLSTAKMKVLKPEMDEINTKFGNEDPMKKQQAVMALYRKAGVNPLGGCLPVLLQMPILLAMFRFFPASIELRQEGFLWATDLSTYDSILDLPFNIPFYGDHVSLFTLLMTASTLIYTRMNSSQFSGNPQMESMKWMMYLLPVVFLGVFNNYSAGLSYYYFLANMLTFTQQWLIRKFVDEEAIHRKIQENKKRPASQQKSRFQTKLEEMAKQAQQRQQQQLNQKKKK